MDTLSSICSLTFDRFIDLCTDKTLIDKLVKELSVSNSLVRVFLSAYTFRYFSSEVMPSERTDADLKIISQSEKLIDTITSTISNKGNTPTLTHNLISEYKQDLTQWKQLDKPRAVAPFINKYISLRAIRESEKGYYTKELKLLIDMTFLQLISMIHSVGGDKALERLESIESTIDVDLKEEFVFAAKEVFWDAFKEEGYTSEGSPPGGYNGVVSLLIDFIDRYREILPNRPDLHEQLLEIIDIEFIKQQIDLNAVNRSSLLSYMEYLTVKLKEIDVPANDSITDELFNSCKREENNGVLLKCFFEYVFSRMDQIKSLATDLTPLIKQIDENIRLNEDTVPE
jgi:hypothetical protein